MDDVLNQIPSELLETARRQLGPASPESHEHGVEVDSGNLGRVRILFKPMKHSGRNGESRRWFWIAQSAERIESHFIAKPAGSVTAEG